MARQLGRVKAKYKTESAFNKKSKKYRVGNLSNA